MLQVQYSEHSVLSESQVYEDLSELIKIFKNLLLLMDNIAAQLSRLQLTIQSVQQLKKAAQSLSGFIKLYSYNVTSESPHKNTFHRFICRLIESLSAYKLKFQTTLYYNALSPYVKQIQQTILSYQNDRNIGGIMKKVQSIALRFYVKNNKCIQNHKIKNQDQDYDQTEQKSKNYSTISHAYEGSQDIDGSYTFTINGTKPKKIIQSKSQNVLNKMMVLLNKKYKSLSCLDIQYNEFKQLFFQSRDFKSQLYQDCFQRNSNIYKEILRYSKQFSQYLQKRQQKILRKNKFIDSLGATNTNIKTKNKFSSTKYQKSYQGNYNFTKKKRQQGKKDSRQNSFINTESQSKQIIQFFTQNKSQVAQPINSRSNLIFGIQSEFKRMTPQLLDQNRKSINLSYILNDKNQQSLRDDKKSFNQLESPNLFQLAKRKKNLHLKKIDISLTNYGSGFGHEIQSAKLKNRMLAGQFLKKQVIQTTKQSQENPKKFSIRKAKQMDERINASIRKNFLQRKYQIALKKNMISNDEQFQKDQNGLKVEQHQNPKFSLTNLMLNNQKQQLQSPKALNYQRKYLIKTSNKRGAIINKNTNIKSLNQKVSSRKQQSPFRTVYKRQTNQFQKMQRLQKIKQDTMTYMSLSSGGRSIKPILGYKTRDQVMYTQGVQDIDQQTQFFIQ